MHAQGADPGAKAGLERLRIETIEDALEGVMRGNAVRQGQETPQPRLAALAEGGDFLPIIRTAENGTNSDDHDV